MNSKLSAYLNTHDLSVDIDAMLETLRGYLGGKNGESIKDVADRIPRYLLRNRLQTAGANITFSYMGSDDRMVHHAQTCIALALGYDSVTRMDDSLSHKFAFPFTRDEVLQKSLESYYGIRSFTSALLGIGYYKGTHIQVNDEEVLSTVLHEQIYNAMLDGSLVTIVHAGRSSLKDLSVPRQKRVALNAGSSTSGLEKGAVCVIQCDNAEALKHLTRLPEGVLIVAPDVPDACKTDLVNEWRGRSRWNTVICEYAHTMPLRDTFDYRIIVGSGDLPLDLTERLLTVDKEVITRLFTWGDLMNPNNESLLYLAYTTTSYPVIQFHPIDTKLAKKRYS